MTSENNIQPSKRLVETLVDRCVGKSTSKLRTVETTIRSSKVISTYAEQLAEEISYELPKRFELPEAFTTRLEQYIQLLVRMRITQVSGKSLGFIRPSADEILVPDFVHLLLAAIGNVSYKERLIDISPTCEFVTRDDAELWDGFKDVRSVFKRVRGPFVFAEGLPRGLNGNPDFMITQVLDGIVTGHRDGIDPFDILLSAFVEKQSLDSIFNLDITYDHIDDLERLVHYLVEPKGRTT